MSGPRVRIAPSPTGLFHVGTARTALFNWLIARQDPEGVFILRIEDTDESRNREEWVEGIYSAMAWLGFTLDEGPFRQSDSKLAHEASASLLRQHGYLYYCDCTPEMVDARKAPGAPPGYDGFCRDRGVEQSEKQSFVSVRPATASPSCTISFAATWISRIALLKTLPS